uniref:Uncharacterized protein n=1 Tax=Moniliophthora roreri TaxID=221103 RepID=A0A0W0GFQ5_MONRR
MSHFNLLPTSLILFVFLSTLFAFITFVLSLVNFSVEVAVVGSISAFATMGYHLTLITLAYRERQKRRADAIFLTKSAQRRAGPTHRYYTMPGIIWAYLLFAIWTISFGINTQVTSNGMGSIKPEDRNNVWNLGIQVAVSCFAGFEALVVGTMAVHNMLARRKASVVEKGTPVSKFNEKRVSEVSTSRRSVASSRFSVDSITALYDVSPSTIYT